jgi:hypothetical protein
MHKNGDLAPYIAIVATQLFFEINKHLPPSVENATWKPCGNRGNIHRKRKVYISQIRIQKPTFSRSFYTLKFGLFL